MAAAISEALALVVNLSNAAHDHRRNCPGETCNVSLLLLKQVAERYRYLVLPQEWAEFERIMKGWPI